MSEVAQDSARLEEAKMEETEAARKEELLRAAARQMLVLRRVMRLVMQQAHQQSFAREKASIGEAQLFMLAVLEGEGRLTAGDLADKCHVSDPTISKALNNLEAQGLVSRQTDPMNRRVVLVTLTDDGKAFLKRVGEQWLGKLADVLRPLTDEQLVDIIRTMGHLEDLVSTAEGAEGSHTHSGSHTGSYLGEGK